MPRAVRSVDVVAYCLATAMIAVAAPAVGDIDGPLIGVSLDWKGPSAERVKSETVKAVDAAIAALAQKFGAIIDRNEHRHSAMVVVHRNATSYRRAIRRIGARRFEENLAVTDYDRRESHVAIQPACTSELIRRIGLPLLTRRQLAHEAAHLWCSERWPSDYRAAPRWLREGLATWASEEAMRSLGFIDKAEADPFLSTRLVLAQRGAARLVECQSPSRTYDPFAGFDRHTMYALDWAYCRWQLEDRRNADVAEASNVTNGMTIDQMLAWFGRDSATAMRSFAEANRVLKPEWMEDSRSLERYDANWIQRAFPDEDAMAWRRRGPSISAYRIRGSLELIGEQASEARVLFARDAFGYMAASFESGGGVAISRFNQKTDSWTLLSRNSDCGIRSGSACEFEVVVRKDRVDLRIGGKSACRAVAADMWTSGTWGLSVQADRAAFWRDLRLESISE
ncbi:MAG: hypothetical protein H6819_06075 [Phycisphaerales bacterium]|nr:hypothetical protein [Phycisphaerales bacterium]MCB9858611.1 hypothetical protein [Phycisphaerales bacterium]